MRALQFKIYVDKLTTKDWSHWKRVDQEHILDCAEKNGVKGYLDKINDTITFEGKQGQLFHFMYDVAYRYDIEII